MIVDVGDREHALLLGPGDVRRTIMEELEHRLSTRLVGAGLAEVHGSCGSPCSVTLYVSTETGPVSDLYDDVVAVDPVRHRVAVPTPDGVEVYETWDGGPALVVLPLPLAPTAAPASAFVRAASDGGGALRVVYLRGADYEQAEASVPVPERRAGR